MSLFSRAIGNRSWLAPEVVQTSTMDCGPAALKCLLEGFGIAVSYGRLREACQTSIDGTSIDTIEEVANQLGILAEQEMLPVDHLFLPNVTVIPAMIVVRNADSSTHFVVVWRRIGPWLQVMDPAIGRRWIKQATFATDIFRHEISTIAAEWREWAASPEFLTPLRDRIGALGGSDGAVDDLVRGAESDPLWFGLAALDASTRLVASLVTAGAAQAGAEALDLLQAVFRQTLANPDDIYRIVPATYWSVVPDLVQVDRKIPRLSMRGAVLLRVGPATAQTGDRAAGLAPDDDLSEELRAALDEKPPNALAELWRHLAAGGLLAPAALCAAMAIATGATLVEALLLRGLFDIGALLNLGSQRLLAVLALLALMALGLCLQLPIIGETARLGRHLDARLRMALLRKLPLLSDRYFQSRPVSDMADRSHSIHLARMVPGIGIHFLQSGFELVMLLLGIAWLDPRSALFAGAIASAAILIPAAFQPMINERDLRVRNHSGALGGFYLDALLGLVAIRTHHAERSIRRQHEGLLVEWARSSQRLLRTSLLADGLQSLVCVGIAAALLIDHFLRAHGVSGSDLLLVYWTMKLPAIGQTISELAHQYPMQRNVLLRLMEPLAAPEEQAAPQEAGPGDATASRHNGVDIAIEAGTVVAGGHTILRDIDLQVRSGEHVAIVGLSGAGKSSLIGLLLGWHRLSDGRLRIDGEDLTDQALQALRRRTAWVDPAVHLWNTPLLDNLVFSGRETDLTRVSAAIERAELRQVLAHLPAGLQTALGEGGAMLSGGEGQRVRLGRALVQSDVQLALLDEPFRGMDRDHRAKLLDEARDHWRDATLLCVTHDVGETLSFNRVLVVDDSRIVEDDAPQALLARPSRYRELIEAETLVRDKLWQGDHWRRIVVDRGTVRSAS